MAKIKANTVTVTLSGNTVASATSCTLSATAVLDETRTKDSDPQHRELDYVDWSVDIEALNGATLATVKAAQLAGTALPIALKVGSTAKFSGSAVISSCEIGAPVDGRVTYKVSLQGSGPLTKN